MKDLFIPPTPTPINDKENALDMERSGSVVRQIEPEDPYSDSHTYRQAYQHQNPHSSAMGPPSQRPANQRSEPSYNSNPSRPLSRSDYPVAPPSRQTSNTSSVVSGAASMVSGSENWETYTDNSETEEADATEAYYAKVKAQQRQHQYQYQQQQQQQQPQQGWKRPAPGTPGLQLGAAKRMRDQQTIVEEGGSDAGWTDDGELGDTY
jgi:protein regulator of cytokinesis 1